MRWLILIPAGPGALLGEHAGLGGAGALLLAAWAWRHPVIRNVRSLPTTSLELAKKRSGIRVHPRQPGRRSEWIVVRAGLSVR
ncbi:MAG: hypothetical protein WCH44_18415 [Betaproteobacteria bacterium]